MYRKSEKEFYFTTTLICAERLYKQCKTFLDVLHCLHLNELFAEWCQMQIDKKKSQEVTLNGPLDIWSSLKPVAQLCYD